MALMKLAFFFLTLSALIEAYHARHLQAASKEVIQMVTSREVYKSTAYGRVAKVPPPPKVAPSKGQDTYSRDTPKAPMAQFQTNWGGYNLKGLDDAPLEYEKTYRQNNLKGPNDAPSESEKTPPQRDPSASITLPKGQTSYITYNLKGPNDPASESDKTPPQREPSASITLPQGQTNYITYNLKGLDDAPPESEKTFGQDNSKTKPSTSITTSRVHANCDGRYNLKGPNDAPSDIEKTFGRDNPNRPDKGQTFSYYLNSYVMRLLDIWS